MADYKSSDVWTIYWATVELAVPGRPREVRTYRLPSAEARHGLIARVAAKPYALVTAIGIEPVYTEDVAALDFGQSHKAAMKAAGLWKDVVITPREELDPLDRKMQRDARIEARRVERAEVRRTEDELAAESRAARQRQVLKREIERQAKADADANIFKK